MKTIQVNQTDIQKNYKLIKKIFLMLNYDEYFHFFYEPELIIRIKEKSVLTKITDFLKKRKLSYRVYSYPYPKSKDFGESKTGVVSKYFDYFQSLLYLNSIISLSRTRKWDMRIIERNTHTFLNQMGYSVAEELIIFLKLAYYRSRVYLRYESTSLGETMICRIIGMFIKINISFGRLII